MIEDVIVSGVPKGKEPYQSYYQEDELKRRVLRKRMI